MLIEIWNKIMDAQKKRAEAKAAARIAKEKEASRLSEERKRGSVPRTLDCIIEYATQAEREQIAEERKREGSIGWKSSLKHLRVVKLVAPNMELVQRHGPAKRSECEKVARSLMAGCLWHRTRRGYLVVNN